MASASQTAYRANTANNVKSAHTVAFHTLGCRVNTSDTQALEQCALQRGLEIVPFNASADVYVINTCTVTAQADQQCRKLARQARRRNPDATVVAVGCFVQAQPQTAAAVEELDLTIDNLGKHELFDRLSRKQDLGSTGPLRSPAPPSPAAAGPATSSLQTKRPAFSGIHLPVLKTDSDPRPGERQWLPHSLGRKRAFLKVQDGCDQNCSYCIIPRSRGASRSRTIDEMVQQTQALVSAGFQEVVVVGVHISDWGQDLPDKPTLPALLRRLIEVPGLPSLRISSLEPEGVSEELAEVLAHPIICPHLHLPIQSGSARILRRMRRLYTPREVELAVERVSRHVPDFGFGSDFICGFPGETDAEFQETVSMVKRLPFTYLHPFPYSVRPQTDAADYGDQVPEEVRKERVRVLSAMGKSKKKAFVHSRVGRTYRTWLFAARGGKSLRGLTGNYLTVDVDAPAALVNQFHQVKLTGVEAGALRGELA